MATTETDLSQKQLAQKSGVNDFLTKPIKPGILQNKVSSLLSGFAPGKVMSSESLKTHLTKKLA
jgi:DNA-binding response OmpR family regulator